MELVLRAAPFFLLPLLLQRWFLELGRRRHRLHVLRWVLPVLSLVLLGLAWQGWHANQIFGGLSVLVYGFLAALVLLGWGCGWGVDALWRRRAGRKGESE